MRELRRMDDQQLGAALADLGAHVAYPATPDVRSRVLARHETGSEVIWRRTRK